MSEYGLLPEDWGGDTVYCEISAKQGIGIEELLETLTVVAELADLKANPNRYAYGSVVEGKLDKGRGPVGLFSLWHNTIISCNNNNNNICYLSSTSTHSCKSFMARCI